MTAGRQHIDHHTRIDHASPHSKSRELYKGVLAGASRAVFNGKVVVHADAQHSDAHQSNRNLLLSEQAEVDTKLSRFTALLEPLMLVFMGGAVAFIVFSILQPIMDLGQLSGPK